MKKNKRKCQICGKEYACYGSSYCSTRCLHKAKRQKKVIKLKQCKICDEFFKPVAGESFCSNKCKVESKTRKYEFYKNCKECNKEFVIKSANHIFCCPECRINHRTKFTIQKNNYFSIFERDGFRCVYCGKSSIEDGVKLVLDHIYPIRKKGNGLLINLVTSCEKCNLHKKDAIIAEDIILRIWDQTNNKNKILKNYNELCQYFMKICQQRQKQNKQYER